MNATNVPKFVQMLDSQTLDMRMGGSVSKISKSFLHNTMCAMLRVLMRVADAGNADFAAAYANRLPIDTRQASEHEHAAARTIEAPAM